MIEKKAVVIATGGSGGHLIPSEALAEKLLENGLHVVLCGHNVETTPFLSDSLNVTKKHIPSFPLKLTRPFCFFLHNFRGFIKAYKLLKAIKPGCVVGFGSYHSFPVLLAAYFLKIPLVLYEANMKMGKVIKLFASKATLIASPLDLYQEMASFCPVKPLLKITTDTPLPRQGYSDYFALDALKKTILVCGGSQGAQIFNEKLALKLAAVLDPTQYQIIHLAGLKHPLEPLEAIYKTKGIRACVKSYEKKMSYAYEFADLVIARSGATTLFELAHFGKKAILIPFVKNRDQHQTFNALYFLKEHPGAHVQESQIDTTDYQTLIERLIGQESLFKTRSDRFELDKKVLELC